MNYNFPEFYFKIDKFTKDLENNKYFESVTKNEHIPYGAELWEDENKKLICITIVDTGFNYDCDTIITPIYDDYFVDGNKMKSLLTFISPLVPETPHISYVSRCLNYLVKTDVLKAYTNICRCRADYLESDYNRLLRIIMIAGENEKTLFKTTINFE